MLNRLTSILSILIVPALLAQCSGRSQKLAVVSTKDTTTIPEFTPSPQPSLKPPVPSYSCALTGGPSKIEIVNGQPTSPEFVLSVFQDGILKAFTAPSADTLLGGGAIFTSANSLANSVQQKIKIQFTQASSALTLQMYVSVAGSSFLCLSTVEVVSRRVEGPSVTLRVNGKNTSPVSVPYGGDLTVEWNSQNVAKCSLYRGATLLRESANQPDTGISHVLVGQIDGASFTIKCDEGLSSFVTQAISTTVGQLPVVDLRLNGKAENLINLNPNDSFSLYWDVSNADQCDLYRDGSKIFSSSMSRANYLPNPTAPATTSQTETYKVSCYQKDASGVHGAEISKSCSVSTKAPLGVPTVSGLWGPSPSPSSSLTIAYGTRPTFSWKATGADSCTFIDATGIDVVLKVSQNGSETSLTDLREVSDAKASSAITGSYAYTLTCFNLAGGSVPKNFHFTVSEPTDQIVFISSAVYKGGELGGLAGADAKCKALAVASNLRAEREWLAILSSNSTHATDRIGALKSKINLFAGTTIDDLYLVSSGTDFWGTENWKRAIDRSETGDVISTNANVWTGTHRNGMNAAPFCHSSSNGSWTDLNGSGQTGSSDSTNGNRMEQATPLCSEAKHLYCISK